MDTKESSEQKDKLDHSIEELDALLQSSQEQKDGTLLDTTHLKQTADKMQAQAQDLRHLSEELKKKIEAAREDNIKSKSFWLKLRIWIYIGLLVFIVVHFILYGR